MLSKITSIISFILILAASASYSKSARAAGGTIGFLNPGKSYTIEVDVKGTSRDNFGAFIGTFHVLKKNGFSQSVDTSDLRTLCFENGSWDTTWSILSCQGGLGSSVTLDIPAMERNTVFRFIGKVDGCMRTRIIDSSNKKVVVENEMCSSQDGLEEYRWAAVVL